MKIKFGTTPNNATRAAFVGLTLLIICHVCFTRIYDILDNAHEALLQSSMSNLTSIKIRLPCDIPYDNCRCSVQLAKNVFLKDCLTDDFLLRSRIFPLVSFILQVCLIRDLFTFSGKYTHFVIYILWTTAVFIFVIISNGIYGSSCFHRRAMLLLQCTGGILFILSIHDLIRQNEEASEEIIDDETSEEITDDETSEEITNEPILWRDLL
jgi:hypothetical protein